MPNVSVNLAVEIDASGSITVFGQAPLSVINPVVATIKLPVRALYDASGASNSNTLNSLFEFWEPSNALGERRATLSGKDASGAAGASEGRDYDKMVKKLVVDLQNILMGEFDCSGAIPFNGHTNPSVYIVPHFGRLALKSYAHYIFGTVFATSAITNDGAFMKAIMSTNEEVTTNGNLSYKYDYSTLDLSTEPVATELDANLAARLVYKIISKNDDAILSIVEQVLGQDASRAMDEDNNALSPDLRQPLKFMDGDKIYMNIRLTKPNVVVGAGQQISDAYLEDAFSSTQNYTLEIELDDFDGVEFDVIPSGTPLWGRWLDGTGNDVGKSITSDSNGNVYVTGYTSANFQSSLMTVFDTSKPGSGFAGFVVKYNSSGVAQWGRWLDGTSVDVGYSITSDSNGNIYVTGYTSTNFQSSLMTVFDVSKPGSVDAGFVVKYNSSGVAQWGRWLDGTNMEQGVGITSDSNGNIYVTGYTYYDFQSELMTVFDTSKPGIDSTCVFVIKYKA